MLSGCLHSPFLGVRGDFQLAVLSHCPADKHHAALALIRAVLNGSSGDLLIIRAMGDGRWCRHMNFLSEGHRAPLLAGCQTVACTEERIDKYSVMMIIGTNIKSDL